MSRIHKLEDIPPILRKYKIDNKDTITKYESNNISYWINKIDKQNTIQYDFSIVSINCILEIIVMLELPICYNILENLCIKQMKLINENGFDYWRAWCISEIYMSRKTHEPKPNKQQHQSKQEC